MIARPANPEAQREAQALLHASLKSRPFKRKQMEKIISQRAVIAYREGDFIFSIAPDLTRERATELLADAYRKQQCADFGKAPRARWTDWLPAISDFEKGELLHGGAKSGAFTRYRRILDGLEFERQESLTQKITRGT